jgi:transcription antitermination factor NusG
MRGVKPLVFVIAVLAVAGAVGCQPGQYTSKRRAPGYEPPSQSQRTVVFRAKVSTLPTGTLTEGKAPDDVVEVVCPGRVYEPPLKVKTVANRADADRSTPQTASASDFSAFRSGDPVWLRENYIDDDYPRIKGFVEDANIRKMNQGIFRGYGQKTIVARCTYKGYVLVFIQYDDARDKGMVEAYQKVQNDWKRTTALADDETVAVLLSAFRTGELVEQHTKTPTP